MATDLKQSVEALQQRKLQLQKEIESAIVSFQSETDVAVQCIHINAVDVTSHSGAPKSFILASVEIELVI